MGNLSTEATGSTILQKHRSSVFTQDILLSTPFEWCFFCFCFYPLYMYFNLKAASNEPSWKQTHRSPISLQADKAYTLIHSRLSPGCCGFPSREGPARNLRNLHLLVENLSLFQQSLS